MNIRCISMEQTRRFDTNAPKVNRNELFLVILLTFVVLLHKMN